jgi:aldehyde dehydrogenase (NAD+)
MAAGNRVIIKPSERVPHSSRLIATLVGDALPEDVAAVVEGGPDTGADLLDLPFDHIFFTGGAAVGRQVMHAAARHLGTATLELGGKSPAIVDGSVDLDQCAEKIIRGKFMNGGQTCIAPDYVVVRDEFYDDFVKVMLAHAVRIEERTEMSALIDDRHKVRLDTMLADAVKAGAILHHSDSHRSGLTIATGVPLTCKLMQEEIFGPILPVLRYRSEEDLIGIVRTNPSPLTMYVFSNDDGLVNRLAVQLKTGSICINETLLHFVHPHLPFGGVGQSGSGRSHGRAGFETFSNPVPIMRQNARRGIIPLVYPPKGPFHDWARELLFRMLGR